jgi:hypothetical protein
MKIRTWILTTAALAGCAAILTAAKSVDPREIGDAVMTVNGRGVTVQEFVIWRSAFSYVDEEFEIQMKEAAKLKMMQIIAREMGLVDAVDYEDIRGDFETEGNGDAIPLSFGASPSNEPAFFSYIFGNLRENLISALVSNGTLNVSGKILADACERRAEEFKNPDIVEARCLYFPISVEGLSDLGALSEKADSGEDLTSLLQDSDAVGALFSETLRLANEGDYERLSFESALYEAVCDLPEGGWRIVKDEIDGTNMIFVFCQERSAGGLKPYQTVTRRIRTEMLEEAFDDYLEERLSQAAVVENEQARALTN